MKEFGVGALVMFVIGALHYWVEWLTEGTHGLADVVVSFVTFAAVLAITFATAAAVCYIVGCVVIAVLR